MSNYVNSMPVSAIPLSLDELVSYPIKEQIKKEDYITQFFREHELASERKSVESNAILNALTPREVSSHLEIDTDSFFAKILLEQEAGGSNQTEKSKKRKAHEVEENLEIMIEGEKNPSHETKRARQERLAKEPKDLGNLTWKREVPPVVYINASLPKILNGEGIRNGPLSHEVTSQFNLQNTFINMSPVYNGPLYTGPIHTGPVSSVPNKSKEPQKKKKPAENITRSSEMPSYEEIVSKVRENEPILLKDMYKIWPNIKNKSLHRRFKILEKEGKIIASKCRFVTYTLPKTN